MSSFTMTYQAPSISLIRSYEAMADVQQMTDDLPP